LNLRREPFEQLTSQLFAAFRRQRINVAIGPACFALDGIEGSLAPRAPSSRLSAAKRESAIRRIGKISVKAIYPVLPSAISMADGGDRKLGDYS